MQITSIIFSTLIAVIFVEGSAIADPALEVPSFDGYCGAAGELCSKPKRAAYAAAEAIAGNPNNTSYHGHCYSPGAMCDKLKRGINAVQSINRLMSPASPPPPSVHGSCYRAGEVCGKAKRDALALAEATAEALVAADPQARPCHAPGSPCSLAEREALDASESASLSFRNRSKRSTNQFCYGAEGPCSNLKRAAEAVAEAIAEPNPDLEAEPRSVHGSEQKRALDDLNILLDRILLR